VRALVRTVPSSYAASATRAHYEPDSRIDLGRARSQHRAVVAALTELGDEVHWLPAPDEQPDAVFVEDTAVVVGRRALVTRSAHPGRRAEADAVAARLRELGLEVHRQRQGTLDGGDVLRVGEHLFVGRSARSDEAGAAALARVFPTCTVHAVALPEGVLHLKCVASTPGDGQTVVIAAGSLAPEVFVGCRVVTVPRAEAYAANVVGDGHRVVVAAGYPGAAEALSVAGFRPVPVEVGELRKGDGSLTCLSVRW